MRVWRTHRDRADPFAHISGSPVRARWLGHRLARAPMIASIDFLANQGALAGGEIMMLAMATAARDAGVAVRVVGPSPSTLQTQAATKGFEFVAIPAETRPRYLAALTSHRRDLGAELLWCNGLLPAVAFTAGGGNRVVHLHQTPTGLQEVLARLSRVGARSVIVPSAAVTGVGAATVMENWTDEIGQRRSRIVAEDGAGPVRVGFIGRFSAAKGLDVLADAMARLEWRVPGGFELVLAGDERFVPDEETAAVEMRLGRLGRLRRMGWVKRGTFFDQVDVVVVPSVWPETFGLVAAEAMGAGLPIIVSDAGALPSVVGLAHPWIVRAGDVGALAKMIAQVADGDGGSAGAVVERARERWVDEFSPEAGTARFVQLLETL